MENKTYGEILRKLQNYHYQKMKKIRRRHLVASVKKAPLQEGIRVSTRKERIVISLATYPPRFASIDLPLKSLLLQSVKPDKILVWVPCALSKLPQNMRKFEEYGVSFRKAPHDFYSHLKYFYTLQEYANDIVITVDDDAIYPPDLTSTLIHTHNRHPSCICARRVHQITWNKEGNINPYTQWHWIQRNIRTPSIDLFAVGVGGVLYPPHSLHIDPLSYTLFTKLCPKQDDLWLKWQEMLQGLDVVWAPNTLPDPPLADASQNVSLVEANVHHGENDKAIKALSDYFGPIAPSGIIRRPIRHDHVLASTCLL